MNKIIALFVLLALVQLACLSQPAAPTAAPPAATATPVPPADPASPASVTSSFVSVMFTVVNQSGESLDLSWVDWQQNRGGQEEKYATIPSGESYEQQTYFADGWLLRDQAGDIILLFFATEQDQRVITITAEALAAARAHARAEVRLASLPGMEGLPVANVHVVNDSGTDLFVFWIDADEVYQSLGTLPPGGDMEMDGLVFGSMVTVNDEAGNIILLYVATEDSVQSISVSDAAVEYQFGVTP